MMGKVASFLLLAAALVPASVQANSNRGELARDRQDIREEQRELNRAYRSGSLRDIRDEREDLREAKREYREDLRDRGLYPYRPGVRLASVYYGPRYVIAEPWRYRLARPVGYDRWVRRSSDAILVNTRTGTIRFVHRGYFR
jgi:Ni/Co efflux regulator RcnB